VGGSLVTVKLGAHWRSPLASALVKTAVSPFLGWLVARAFGVTGMELKMVLILMACPTAIVSYTMAVELKGDEPLAAGVIALSVLTSVVSLAVIVGMF
jgi:predicted permease